MKLQTHDRLHFIGIGGSGMAPLAELAFKHGFQVSGSDTTPSKVTSDFQLMGIPVVIGSQDQDLISSATSIIISSAIKNLNSSLQHAHNLKKKILHRSDLLAFLLETKPYAICVTGTNGKTTTSAMTAYLLAKLNKHPDAVIGAKMLNFDSPILFGNGEHIVAEADESDGSFLKYRPYIGIITNINDDHMDYYQTKEKLCDAFASFLKNIKKDGTAIISGDNKTTQDLLLTAPSLCSNIVSFGFSNDVTIKASDYRCINGKSYFKITHNNQIHDVELNLIGIYNAYNALAALSCIHSLGLDFQEAVRSLKNFSGVSRRLNLVYNVDKIKIYDDYAHNPSKVSSCIGGVRASWPNAKLVVFFQAHRYSRLKTLYNEFIASFSKADLVIVLPVYGVDEPEDTTCTPEIITRDIKQISKVQAIAAHNFDDACEIFRTNIHNDTIALTVGAGDIWKLALILKEKIS